MNPTPHTPFPPSLTRPVRYALLACTLLMAGWAQAQLAIQSLTVAAHGGGELVRIQTSEPLRQLPAGFSMQAPARIALDIPGASNATGQNLFELNQGNLRSANVVQAGDRTRIVLNLSQPVGYELRIEGNTLLVQLQPGAQAAAPAAGGALGAAFAAAGPAARTQPLVDIDFRRGAQNAGRVLVELASSQTGVDVRQQGRNLVVEFQQSSLPEGLRRRLDVSDFGTPVQTVTATQVGDRVRLLVEPTGNWEHSAIQTDNRFVLEVREVRQEANRQGQQPNFTGDKISLNFQNIEVRSLLQVIADFTDFNIITSEAVTGSLTMRLQNVPWDQALDIVLQAKNLGMRRTDNVIWVAPNEHIIQRERQELEAQVHVQALEPLRTQFFALSFARAQDVQSQLTGAGAGAGAAGAGAAAGAATAGAATAGAAAGAGAAAPAASSRILSNRGSVNIDSRTNQVFVTDVPSGLERVAEFIRRIDVPVSQVLIEARIVEADDTFSRTLGVRLGGTVGTGTAAGAGSGNFHLDWGSFDPAAVANRFGFVNLPARAIGGVSPATLAATLFSPSANRFLNLEISAMQADDRGQIVASPRVITTNQNPAIIEQGVKIPVTTPATANQAATTRFENATLRLEVTPQVTPDGSVILNVQINKDSVGAVTPGGLAIDTKRISTQVLVENGGTVVIGGIFESTESNVRNQVPGLGDIPVLGHLFRSTSRETVRRELLVFLTPRVLTTGAALR